VCDEGKITHKRIDKALQALPVTDRLYKITHIRQRSRRSARGR
jgi:hypothetical protein